MTRIDNPLLDAALAYAGRGWKVLPLHTPTEGGGCSCGGKGCELDPEAGYYKGKHPRTPNGLDDATSDLAIIRRWWGKWPNANIGLVCGETSGGALVIDFDKPELYQAWRDEVDSLADGLTVQTSGKGYHAILQSDTPGGNVKLARTPAGADGKRLTLIETRGNGGYIMAAPSLHPNGREYKVIQGTLTAVPHLKAGDVDRLLLTARKFDQKETPPEPKADTDTWRYYTLANAYAPRPPLEYVAGGFSLPSLSIVFGDAGTLKSFYLADMMACVVAGVPHLDPLPGQSGEPLPTLQAPAMWIDYDNGLRRTLNRFEALGRARNLPDDLPLYLYSMPAPVLNAGDDKAIGRLAERVSLTGARLVVIDNLGLVSGDADENTAGMTAIMGGFRWLAEETGAAVVLIHHQIKQTGLRKAGDTLRGHSSIKASLDLALLVEREPDSSVITLKSVKTRDADVKPYAAQFSFEHKPESNELAAARFWRAEPIDREAAAKTRVKDSILEILRHADSPLNTELLKRAAKGKAQMVTDCLTELTMARLIVCESKGRARLYRLPG